MIHTVCSTTATLGNQHNDAQSYGYDDDDNENDEDDDDYEVDDDGGGNDVVADGNTDVGL